MHSWYVLKVVELKLSLVCRLVSANRLISLFQEHSVQVVHLAPHCVLQENTVYLMAWLNLQDFALKAITAVVEQ